MTLFVVYVRKTSHVVGAVDSIGAPALPPPDPATGLVTATGLVDAALPLRVSLGAGKVAELSLPAGDLAAHSPDDMPGALTAPLTFGVVPVPGQRPKPALVPLKPWTGGLKFTSTGFSVTLPPDTSRTAAAQVVVLASSGEETVSASGQIAADRNDVELALDAEVGVNGVLVLVEGWVGRLEALEKKP